jgi:hypothetical protein
MCKEIKVEKLFKEVKQETFTVAEAKKRLGQTQKDKPLELPGWQTEPVFQPAH